MHEDETRKPLGTYGSLESPFMLEHLDHGARYIVKRGQHLVATRNEIGSFMKGRKRYEREIDDAVSPHCSVCAECGR